MNERQHCIWTDAEAYDDYFVVPFIDRERHSNTLFLKGYFVPNVFDIVRRDQFGNVKTPSQIKQLLHDQVMEFVQERCESKMPSGFRGFMFHKSKDSLGERELACGYRDYTGNIFLYNFKDPADPQGLGDTVFIVGMRAFRDRPLFRKWCDSTRPKNCLFESIKSLDRQSYCKSYANLVSKCENKEEYNWVYHCTLS